MANELAGLGAERSARRWTAVRPDGVRVAHESVGMALGPNAGETGPPPRLVMARDVTALEQAEAEREALIRNLEAKNAELERFTYTVSHDLRSPLITVAGFLSQVEGAAARGDMATLRGDVDRIRRATRKMDQWLQDLLDNAAKFMGDQKNPLVRIGVRNDQGETVLFVQDNGIGIEARHHASIFGLFDKLEKKAEGTGVGLALVKRIIELHGGRIWVESEGIGAGATFCFTLPRASDSPGAKTESRP